MRNPRIVSIEYGVLEGARPRNAGSNARLGEHGLKVRVPIIRLTTEDGATGFGFSRATQETVAPLLAMRLDDAFMEWSGPARQWQPVEYPLWDLACKRAGLPAYAAALSGAGRAALAQPVSVPCYDTSLYFDDLHLADHAAAAELIASEAREGLVRGQRAFKIKVGRGGRHMPLEDGMQRDVAIVCAVRATIGTGIPLMVDANNGFNLNLTKRFLSETAGCSIYWMEEAFHEDAVLYRDLREWMERQGLKVLLADGEGDASPRLLDWAREHVIDVVQRDVISPGFSELLRIAQQVNEWGGLLAPHHYGTGYGNYASCHLAAASKSFAFVEWDEAAIAGISAPGYVISEGRVSVPAAPGFGLILDEAIFRRAVEQGGYTLALR